MCVSACSSAALRMFGYSKRDLIGANINSLIPDPIATVHHELLVCFIRTGHDVSAQCCYSTLRNGVCDTHTLRCPFCFADHAEELPNDVCQAPRRLHLPHPHERQSDGGRCRWGHAEAEHHRRVYLVLLQILHYSCSVAAVTGHDGGERTLRLRTQSLPNKHLCVQCRCLV